MGGLGWWRSFVSCVEYAMLISLTMVLDLLMYLIFKPNDETFAAIRIANQPMADIQVQP